MSATIRDALAGLVDAVEKDSADPAKGISGFTSARLSDAHEALEAKPFGYLLEKAGINNGYYFCSPQEYRHVEERFRHCYLPVYAGVAPEKKEDES